MSQGDTLVLAGTGSTVGDAATRVTTSRSGGRSTGRMPAASSAASRLERVEEPRQHLDGVLGREHLRDLADAGDAKTPVAKRRHHLRMLLDQFRSHLPVVGRSLREPEFPVEELGHGIVLSREELGQAIRKHACVAHPFSIARDPDDPAV